MKATGETIFFCLVLLRIYVALAVFQPYRDLEAGDNQSLKFKGRGGELNPGPLAPQAKSLTTRPPPLPGETIKVWVLVTRNEQNDTKCENPV